MALFPGRYRNPDGSAAVTYQWFHLRFKAWVDELDIGCWVAHKARWRRARVAGGLAVAERQLRSRPSGHPKIL